MLNTKKAFTLTELLVALGVIGAIAALTVPSMMNSINKRIQTTQLKSIVTEVKNLASTQMVKHHTNNLNFTDFADKDKLMTDKNFTVGSICKTAQECWQTNKVSYNSISGGPTGYPAPSSGTNYKSVILKNGATLAYTTTTAYINSLGENAVGEFCVDINGVKKPNKTGRDYFCFFVSQKGRIAALSTNAEGYEAMVSKCKNWYAANYCTWLILDSGWKMNY